MVAFCPCWNRPSGYEFAFPAHNVFAKTTIHGLRECLIHYHGILYRTVSDQETHFIAKEVWEWAYAHEIHWSYRIFHCPEAAGLTEWWNGLLKIHLQCLLGGNTLQG